MKTYCYFLLTILCVISCGCGDSSRFLIEGKVAGAGSQTIRFTYFDGTQVMSSTTSMKEGVFTFYGTSAQPTIVEIENSGRRVFGRLIARNGDHIKCNLNINDITDIDVKGNPESEKWAKFMRDNSRSLRNGDNNKTNDAIARFIKENPTSIASTAILLSCYNSRNNEIQARQLLESIAIEARPASMTDGYYALIERVADKAANAKIKAFNLPGPKGKIVAFNPRQSETTLLCFLDRSSREDSIVETMTDIYNSHKSKLKLIDISCDLDSMTWKRALLRDSVDWQQCWAPAAVANPAFSELGIPRLPFFIVADSTATQLYRGMSISEAKTIITQKLKK